MRFTVRFLGLDLIDICVSTEPECVELDEACSLDGGYTASQPINVAWRPGEGIDHVPESPYEDD